VDDRLRSIGRLWANGLDSVNIIINIVTGVCCYSLQLLQLLNIVFIIMCLF